MNSAYLVGLEPFYDTENVYYQQAYMEYSTLKESLDDDSINSFIEDICNLRALGCVNAEDMLKCIHRFSNKVERRYAFRRYDKWKRSQTYIHMTINETGDEIEQPCTQYVAHYERKTNPKARIRYIERVSIVSRISEDVRSDSKTVDQNDKE